MTNHLSLSDMSVSTGRSAPISPTSSSFLSFTPFQLSAASGNVLIGINQLAEIINKSPSTIATWISDPIKKNRLPPRFNDGSNSVVWLLSVVWQWMAECAHQTDIAIDRNQLTTLKECKNKRGRPTESEKLAAKNSGMSVKEYRNKLAMGKV